MIRSLKVPNVGSEKNTSRRLRLSIFAYLGASLLGITRAVKMFVTGMTDVFYIGRRKGKGKAVSGKSREDGRERELWRAKR